MNIRRALFALALALGLVLVVLLLFLIIPLLVSGTSALDTLLTIPYPLQGDSRPFVVGFPKVLYDERISIELTSSEHPEQLKYETERVRVQVGCDQYIAYLDAKAGDARSPASRAELEALKAAIEASSCGESGVVLVRDVGAIAPVQGDRAPAADVPLFVYPIEGPHPAMTDRVSTIAA